MRPIDHWMLFWSIIFLALIPLFVVYCIVSVLSIYLLIQTIVMFCLLEVFIVFLIVVVSDIVLPPPYAQTWKEVFGR